MQAGKRERIRMARARLGDSVLRADYDSLSRAGRFRAGQENVFRALASGDSGWIDSAWKSARAPAPSHAGSAAWQTLRAQDLPPEALPAADSFAPSGLTAPMRVPFGFMIVRLASRRNLPDTSFEAALPALIAFADRPPENPFRGCRPGPAGGRLGDPERSASEWMRKELALRFVELPAETDGRTDRAGRSGEKPDPGAAAGK